MIDWEKHMEGLESEMDVQPLTQAERDNLEQMLLTKTMRKVFQRILSEAFARASTMAVMEMSTTEGIHKVIKDQGVVFGLRRAVDLMMDLVLDPDAKLPNRR